MYARMRRPIVNVGQMARGDAQLTQPLGYGPPHPDDARIGGVEHVILFGARGRKLVGTVHLRRVSVVDEHSAVVAPRHRRPPLEQRLRGRRVGRRG